MASNNTFTSYAHFFDVKRNRVLEQSLRDRTDLTDNIKSAILRKNSIVKRVTTIAFSYDRTTNILQYGAVQYKYDSNNPSVKYCRKSHNETARQRLLVRPVVIENFENVMDASKFKEKVRHMVYSHGVRGPRVKTN